MVLEDIFCLKYDNLHVRNHINFQCQAHFFLISEVTDLIFIEAFLLF